MLETKEWKDEVDRNGWPSGIWDQEPDRKQWEDKETGLPCLIVRNDFGNLCGYVGVNNSHILFGKDYSDLNLDVHGGLTYAGECHGRVCHEVKTNFLGIEITHLENDKTWWLGFDCAHYGDYSPGLSKYRGFNELNQQTDYKNVSYVTEQCTNLAKQIKNYA